MDRFLGGKVQIVKCLGVGFGEKKDLVSDFP